MAPIDNVTWLSVSAVQVVPPSVVFHTPPPAGDTKMVLADVGSGAIAVMRPLTFPFVPFELRGPGPIAVQAV
jgi:hypothetical protein